MSSAVPVLIASYLEPEHVGAIAAVDDRLEVLYEPELLRRPRYPADHNGEPASRSAGQERRWQQLLARAEVLFDFDQTHRDDLPELAPNVRWIQATSAGIGQFLTAFSTSIATLVPARLLIGIGSATGSVTGPATQAYTQDVVGKFPEQSGLLLGLIQATGFLAFALGPALGGPRAKARKPVA